LAVPCAADGVCGTGPSVAGEAAGGEGFAAGPCAACWAGALPGAGDDTTGAIWNCARAACPGAATAAARPAASGAVGPPASELADEKGGPVLGAALAPASFFTTALIDFRGTTFTAFAGGLKPWVGCLSWGGPGFGGAA